MENEDNNFDQLDASILATLVYFDMFDYPMTVTEIWKWMFLGDQETGIRRQELSINSVRRELADSEYLKSEVESQSGFYYLVGRDELLEKRRERHLIAQKRWKKLRRITKIIQTIPFIQTIAACNTLAIHDIKPTSDIDVFIIIKAGRIWTTRFLTTLLVGLLGQWRHKDHIAKKICLSFYITDDALDLRGIEKKPYDIYLYYWIALVSPLLDRGAYDKFLKNNRWVGEYVSNGYGYRPIDYEREIKKNNILNGLRKFSEKLLRGKLGDSAEKILKRYQMRKMNNNSLTVSKEKTSDVIISDQMLKFHEIDKRDYFREQFEKRMRQAMA